MTMLALAFCGYTFTSGCSGRPDGQTPPAVVGQNDTGAVQAALQLAGGAIINSASYTINGPSGFTRTGTIDLHASNTLSATIAGLPAGMGFKITISANSTDGATTCGGS
ncbi:MAG TPA: hypothetical protein VMU50_05305, partial [Polyangia bacterium]|nr:hypothetical protein [Polyangia bacterium]